MIKKMLLPLLAIFMLGGCTNSNTALNIAPKIQLPQQDPALPGVTISINGADQRTDQALAKVNQNGQLITLTSSRDIRFLLQEVLEKQMAARGYMIGSAGAADLNIVVNHLYADVTQGNIRYGITTKADISIIATAKNGNKQVKNYRQTYSVEGAFSASNNKIANAVNTVLSDIINEMAQDSSISNFIKQNTR
ncbi:lipoprotein [Enterobacteriaceae bacterium LUAb1]